MTDKRLVAEPESGVRPNLFAIESCIEAHSSRTWDLVDRLRNLRRKMDGSTPYPEVAGKAEDSEPGVLGRMGVSLESNNSALNDLLREIELLESLVG